MLAMTKQRMSPIQLFLILLIVKTTSFASIPNQWTGKNLITGDSWSTPSHFQDKKGHVIIFMSAKCPCSNSHAAELIKLADLYKDFRFTAVHSNMDETYESAQDYFKKLGLKFDIVQDEKAEMADQLKAFKTPHVFVLSPNAEILYHGGITNSSHAPSATQHFLADALEDIHQNRPVKVSEGRTLGCVISRTKN